MQRSLEYISGYLALEMVDAAREELARIGPEYRGSCEAVEAEMAILYAAEAWAELEAVARRYTGTHPDQIQGWLSLAFAARRSVGIVAAKNVLLGVDSRLGDTAAILHYNLACYHCLLDEIEPALERLVRSFKLEPALKATSLQDEDLKSLWSVIQQLG